MKNKGFVVLYRDIFDWDWFDDVYVFKLFVCLIMLASHETKKYKGIQIKKGSLITSVKALSEKTKLSETSVKNSLKKLVSTGEITEEIKPNKYRIIAIKNYSKYQSVGFSKTDSKTNSKTDKRQSVGFSKTNNKTTINKYKSLTDSYTEQAAPRAPSEEPAAAAPVTYVDVRQYQIDNRIGCGSDASEFSSGFEKSGTKFPPDWQKVYRAFVKADEADRERFLDKLSAGGFRDKWGAVE